LVAVVPLAVAAALLVRPSLDGIWQEQRLHFWIVSAAALGGTIVAAAAAEAAGKRDDVRIFLLAYSFAVAAAGLGLHALATPTVLVRGPNAGFESVVPAALAMAAVLAAIATMPLSEGVAHRILGVRRWLWLGFGVVVVVVGALIVTETGFLAEPPDETAQNGLVLGLGAAGSVLFAFAALRLFSLHRARVGVRMLTIVTLALVLLGDALAVMPIGRTWQASWWEWHLLMVAAFVATAWTLRGELQRESGRSGVLDSLALDATLERVRRDDATALERIVDALERVDDLAEDEAPVLAMVDDIVVEYDLTDRQGRLLQQAAHALHDNRRLYRELDGLFRSYLSPDVAAALLAEPSLASLGGTDRTISVLHADLSGFTRFAESRSPREVVDMLNTSFGAVVPAVLAERGTITMFAGDALMAVFGAPATQPDHAVRACAAARALLAAAEAAAAPGWPRFRVGVSTGPAIVGNVGSDALRSYTAIGDTVNVAARLEAVAPVGGICISEATRVALGDEDVTEPRGEVVVRGRADPVVAHLLH
jgi:class 3 adenylate cyclase